LILLQVEPVWQQVGPENPLPPPRKKKKKVSMYSSFNVNKGELTLSPLGSAVVKSRGWSWSRGDSCGWWVNGGGGSWLDGGGGDRTRGGGDGRRWDRITTSKASSERTTLNIDTREVPVLSSRVVGTTLSVRKTKDTQMPISRVGRSRSRERTSDLDERGRARRVPEGDLVGREVNLVGKVVPDVGDPVDVPLGLTANEPAKVVVWALWVAVDPSVLHLSEVRLEEVDLVLVVGVWRVGAGLLHAEVVVERSGTEVGLGLGNELSTPHVGVPEGGGVNGDLGSLLGRTICRVLVVWREVDVGRDWLRSVARSIVSKARRAEECKQTHM
jgi:hypothetical protein